MFEGVPVGLFRSSVDGRILDANPALVQLLGYPERSALLSVDVADLYVDSEDRVLAQEATGQSGFVRGMEVQFRRYDKSPIWVRISTRVFRDGRGHVLFYEGSLEDISDQRRVEAESARLQDEYERQNRLLNTIFGVAPMSLAVIAGPELQIHLANPSFCQLLSQPECDPIGCSIAEIFPPTEGAEVEEIVRAGMLSGSPVDVLAWPYATRMARCITFQSMSAA